MLDKWIGKLMDGRPYADSQKEYRPINEEELKTELAEMKSKIRTRPEEVEAWFDEVTNKSTLANEVYNLSRTTDKSTKAGSATCNDIDKEQSSEMISSANPRPEENKNNTYDAEILREFTNVVEGSSAADAAFSTISRLTVTAKDKLSPIARSGISQLNVFKEEGSDLRKLLSSREIIIYKTDAIAIILRKYGGIIEFLDAYDNLIREGYLLDHSEAIESFFEIPINGIKTRLGKLYYFHHRKYTTKTPPPEPAALMDSDLKKYVASVFLTGSNMTVTSSSQPSKH